MPASSTFAAPQLLDPELDRAARLALRELDPFRHLELGAAAAARLIRSRRRAPLLLVMAIDAPVELAACLSAAATDAGVPVVHALDRGGLWEAACSGASSRWAPGARGMTDVVAVIHVPHHKAAVAFDRVLRLGARAYRGYLAALASLVGETATAMTATAATATAAAAATATAAGGRRLGGPDPVECR